MLPYVGTKTLCCRRTTYKSSECHQLGIESRGPDDTELKLWMALGVRFQRYGLGRHFELILRVDGWRRLRAGLCRVFLEIQTVVCFPLKGRASHICVRLLAHVSFNR
jgi:hypothetical protein